MTNYVFIGRHGDRQDFQNPNIYSQKQMKDIQNHWFKSKRFLENPYDPPITNFGFKSAEKAGENIYKQLQDSGMKNILLYSSPFSRCIMTSAGIQKTLRKKGYNVPIRIEYGLAESITLPEMLLYNKEDNKFEYTQINDTKLTYGGGKNKDINLDEQLMDKNIHIRFPNFLFDKNYKSIIPFIPSIIENYPDYASRLIWLTNKVINDNPDTFIIMIGHADLVRFGYNYYSGKYLPEEEYNDIVNYQGFGTYLMFKTKNNNVEIIDFKKSNLEYNKDLPIYKCYKKYTIRNIIFTIIAILFLIKLIYDLKK